MATVRIQQNILDNKVDTFSVESGITIETLIREHTDGDTYSSTLVECYDLETGKTYFAPIEEDSGSLNAIVQVNGKDESLDYTLKENDIVAIVITPASGGGSSGGVSFEWGWDWDGALAGMVSGMLVGAVYGGLPGLIIGGVVGFAGGGLLVGSVKATIDSMRAKDIKSTGGIDSERLPDVRGATNQPLLDQSYPFVIGKHLVAPFIIGSPWNEISGKHGETNYIHVLYAVGYAPLRITDIKLGDMFLAHNQRWADNKDMKNIFHGALTGIDSGNNSKGIDYYQSNTTIDLRNRPLVDSETMNTAGWDVEEGEVATVYSCAYSNQDETKTVLVTPILSNGTVLTPVQTETYANQLLNNETISVDILLNTFTGSDSIVQSDEYAEGLHNSQATYYGLNGDIVNTWANNDITVEILQQGQNGQTIDYGTVYPHAKIQQDINANSLYIADGSLEEIDSGNNISYKGLGLKNGLRNNPIRFTEQFAKSAKIELDFNNGLYKSRSETSGDNSEQKYYKIPMWVALQWRVYSEENDETDGSVSGELPLPTYDPITKTYISAKRGWNSFSLLNEDVSVSLYTEDARYQDIKAHTGNNLRNVGPSSTVITHEGRYHYTFQPKIRRDEGTIREVLLKNINNWTFISGEDLRSSVQSVNDIVDLECHYNPDFHGHDFDIYITDAYFSVVQKETHSTTVYDADINKGWINANVFNLEKLGGTNADQDGINEFRCSTELDFVEWARYSLLTAEERASADVEQILAEKFRAYFYDGSNTTKSVEVRVVRVSPCYIDETTSNKDHSAFKFNDVFTWTTLTSTMLNGDKLTKEGVIEQRRPISEERMRKLCVLSLRAKTDNVDQLTNTIKKLSCIAQSFSPYYNEETKQWSPVSVTKVKKYYKPAEKVDKNGNRGASAVVPPFTWEPGAEITEQQFYEDRQNGIKSTCVPAGNNFVPQMVNNIIRTVNHKDHKNRYYIPYDDMDNGSYKADCDGTLNYCKNITSSMFILAGIGPQLGIDALGYEQNFYSNGNLKSEVGDFDMNALAKWNEEVKCVKDGSFYTSDGYHYNERGERVHHVAGEEVEMYFAANAYVYQPDLLENILAKIAVAGRAVYTRDAKGRITVIMDKPEKYPVALINQQNTLKSSYTLSFEELPAGLQMVFPDENDGYEQNNFYCMRDGEDADNPRGAIEQYRFDFVTNNYQQNSLGNYLLANRILNREVVSKQMGIEGASIGLGNLVLISDDTMLIGTDTGARITKLIEDDGKVYGFIINNSYKYTGEEEVVDGVLVCKQGVMVMQPSQYKEYKVITLRLATANTVVTVDEVDYQLKKGNTNVVLFNVPIVKTRDVENGDFYYYRPEVDNLVSFGVVGKITATYRVIKVKGNNNHTFDFTLSKYQEDLYTSGRALPSFQNNMSLPDRSDEDSFALSESVNQNDLVKAISESVEQASGLIDENSYTCSLTMSSIGSTVIGSVYKAGILAEGTLYYEDCYGTNGQQPSTAGSTGTIIEGDVDIPAVTNADKHLVKIYADSEHTNLLCTSFVSFGASGSGSSSYWLIEDASAIKKDSNGNFTPGTINLTAMTQSGSNTPTTYAGKIGIAVDTGSGYGSETTYDGPTKSYNVPANTVKIRFRLYLAGGTATLLDEDVVTVVNDGIDGQDGQDGQDGRDGQDGFSPTATVTKSGSVTTITITDKNGTTTKTVSDGTNGVDSLSCNANLSSVEIATGTDLKPVSVTQMYVDIVITAYKGTTSLTATTGTPTASQYKVTAPSNLTGITFSMPDAKTVRATWTTSTAILATNSATIQVAVGGSTNNFTKTIVFSAAVKGATGAQGASIQTYQGVFSSGDIYLYGLSTSNTFAKTTQPYFYYAGTKYTPTRNASSECRGYSATRSTAFLAFVNSAGATWASGVAYKIGDLITYSGNGKYICTAAHTSSSSILPTNTSYWRPANVLEVYIKFGDETICSTITNTRVFAGAGNTSVIEKYSFFILGKITHTATTTATIQSMDVKRADELFYELKSTSAFKGIVGLTANNYYSYLYIVKKATTIFTTSLTSTNIVAQPGDVVFERGVTSSTYTATGASDTVKALKICNGYSWETISESSNNRYLQQCQNETLLALAACAKVYKANNVTIPDACGTVVDLLIANKAVIDTLVADSAFINDLSALNINFQNSVSSYKTSGYTEGDLCISMGKNPKNSSDSDLNFNIQSYIASLPQTSGSSSNTQFWKKEFYTKYNSEKKQVDFTVNGVLNTVGGIATFNSVFGGAELKNVKFTPPSSVTFPWTDTYGLACVNNYVYLFRCRNANGYVDVYKAPLPQSNRIEYKLTFTTDYTLSSNRYNISDVLVYNNNIYIVFASSSIYKYNYSASTKSFTAIKNAGTSISKLNLYKNKMIFQEDRNTVLYDGSTFTTVFTSYNSPSQIFSEFTDGIYFGAYYGNGFSYIGFYKDNNGTPAQIGFINIRNTPYYKGTTQIGQIDTTSSSGTVSGIYGAYGKLYISYISFTSSDSWTTYILCSKDCGSTWHVLFEADVESDESFSFEKGFSENGLVLLYGSGSTFLSIDNGETFEVSGKAKSGNRLSGVIQNYSSFAKDIIFLGFDQDELLSSGGVFDIKKIRSPNLANGVISAYNFTDTAGYIVYSNGLKLQWGIVPTAPSSATYTINGLMFTNKNYTIHFKTMGSDRTERDFRLMNYNTDKNMTSYKFTMSPASCEFSWFAIGY